MPSNDGFRGFRVARNDLRRWQWEERADAAGGELAPGQVVVAVGRFGFTANNVTYARLGDQIGYWRFFPAADGWGYVPVWGLGEVVRSRHAEVHEGERVYGYFPMATHLVMQPGGLRGARFVDGTAHRQELPPVYNEYVLVDRDPAHDRAHEDAHLVLRPLFSLSFFCAEFLKQERLFGARQVVISSASSKTALGLAFLLAQASRGEVEIVGLTSAANAAFVASRGVYDRVVTYPDIPSLPDVPAVLIDVAGNGAARARVHARLRDSLKHSALVGFTHWDTLAPAEPGLPGPRPTLFFTPDHVLRRREEWGARELGARLSEAWNGFVGYVEPWLAIEHSGGAAGVERVYQEVLDGRAPPDKAHVLSIGRP